MPTKRLKTEIEELQESVDKYASFSIIYTSKAGQDFVKYLETGLIDEIDNLLHQYREDSTKLLPIIARIDERLTILRLLTKADVNKDIWTDALKEALKKEKEQES